jgi:dUTP pyrophosphatase
MDIKILFINELSSKVYNDGLLLSYATTGSSGVDLRAVAVSCDGESFSLESGVFILKSGSRCLVKCGIAIQMNESFIEAQVRSRSGLALKNGVMVLNSPGTIDSDYRGEIGVILQNFDSKDFTINIGDRIAQLVFSRIEKVNFDFVSSIDQTKRGDGGFGSTGKS